MHIAATKKEDRAVSCTRMLHEEYVYMINGLGRASPTFPTPLGLLVCFPPPPILGAGRQEHRPLVLVLCLLQHAAKRKLRG